jgi:cytochrome c-type biogenesis protein
MTIEFASIPVAALAGVLGVLSPCVWPLVPVILSSATEESGRAGPVGIAAGLAISFAVAGTLVSFVLVQSGLDPELVRRIVASFLILVAVALLVPKIGGFLAAWGSRITSRLPGSGPSRSKTLGPFGIGLMLGFVWLPCVGPTLGAAIGLASVGQDMGLAFLIMLAYGLGTGATLLAAALFSRKFLLRVRPGLLQGASQAKQLLGVTLGLLGLLVLTGLDKAVETWAVGWIPDWAFAL